MRLIDDLAFFVIHVTVNVNSRDSGQIELLNKVFAMLDAWTKCDGLAIFTVLQPVVDDVAY